MSIAAAVRDRTARVIPAGPPPPRLLDGLSVVAAAAPFWVVGVLYGLTGHLVWGGDQALVELDAWDVRHLDQAVGSYSRMGWAHPGPVWTVLLTPLYWLFGSNGEALVAASMILHGAFAALVVVVAGTGARWQRPLAALVVLGYVLRMPSIDFVGVWNPFALLLPTALLLLLAARACAGSLPAAAAALAVGSLLVQTHVGTAPLVGGVGAVVLVVLVVRGFRHRLARPGRRGWLETGLAGVAAVLMWVPPVWQQLRAAPGPGNLGLLAQDLLHGDPAAVTPTWRESVSTTGQLLGAPVYGWPAEPALVKASVLTPAVVAAVVVQLLGCAVVAALAWRLRAAVPGWLAAVTGVATVAGLVSVKAITGPLMNYLVLWITVLPAVLLFAGVSLLARWLASAPDRVPARFTGVTASAAFAAAGTALALLVAVVLAVSLHRSTDTQLGDQPGAAEASELAVDALPAAADDDPPVLLDIRDVSVWTTATTVAVELTEAGHRVSVDDAWVYGFGADRRSTGDEDWRVTLEPVSPGEGDLPGQVGVVQGAEGLIAVIVQRTH